MNEYKRIMRQAGERSSGVPDQYNGYPGFVHGGLWPPFWMKLQEER
jgi:hypothetical protein